MSHDKINKTKMDFTMIQFKAECNTFNVKMKKKKTKIYETTDLVALKCCA